jgi:hypothetical protein
MEKGISYGPDMVAAKLARLKLVTRRLPDNNLIINVEPDRYKFHCMDADNLGTREKPVALFSDLRPEITPWLEPIPSPYGGVGDWLYTKEAYYTLSKYDHVPPSELPASAPIHYAADGPKPDGYGRYRHARFMPKALARFWDEITDLRMERLQDISKADALAEGYTDASYKQMVEARGGIYLDSVQSDPRAWYFLLWASISGQESLDLNPWVWVVTYKELSRTGRPSDTTPTPPAPTAEPVMVATAGGTPEQAETSDLVIIPELQQLLDKHPGQDEVALAAYELGMGNLREVLAGFGTLRKPGQQHGGPATCINDLPGPLVRILNVAVAAQHLKLWLPFGLQREYFTNDEMRGLRFLEAHLDTFLRNVTDALASRKLFRSNKGGSDTDATKAYITEMGDVLTLALDELNAAPDPREPLAAMKMLNELNMVQAAPAEAEEELACA